MSREPEINKLTDLQQAVLLKEYEMCQQEAESFGNWIWSSAIFASAWVATLGLLATRENNLSVVWMLTAAAVFSQFFWVVFLIRTYRAREIMYLRQRQIESQLKIMLKSTALDFAGKWRNTASRMREAKEEDADAIRDFLERASIEVPYSPLEETIMHVYDRVFGRWIGGQARSALYLMSVIVALAWLAYAISAQIGHSLVS